VFWVWTNNNSFTIKIPSVLVFCIIIIKLEKKIQLTLFINTIYNDFSFSSDKKFGKNKTTHGEYLGMKYMDIVFFSFSKIIIGDMLSRDCSKYSGWIFLYLYHTY